MSMYAASYAMSGMSADQAFGFVVKRSRIVQAGQLVAFAQ